MKKYFKKITAAVVAMAALTTGMTGIVSSAADVPINPTSIVSGNGIQATSHNYTFSGVTQSGKYASGDILTLTAPTRIDVSFYTATPSQALVTIVSSSNINDTYGSFIIPTSSGAGTLHYYVTLPAGSYRFYVTPYLGSSTSGSFTVTV